MYTSVKWESPRRGRALTVLLVVAMVLATLPLIAAPAFAGKPPKDPAPASPAPNFKSVETAAGYFSTGSALEIAVPADAVAGECVQFEREGYFCLDGKSSTADMPVFNRTVTLRDSWAKIERQHKA